MSTRRHVRQWVRCDPGAGFVGEANRLRAEIQPEEYPNSCMMECGDPECVEWATLWTEPDPLAGGKRYVLCHVSECQMHDAEAP